MLVIPRVTERKKHRIWRIFKRFMLSSRNPEVKCSRDSEVPEHITTKRLRISTAGRIQECTKLLPDSDCWESNKVVIRKFRHTTDDCY